MERFLWVCLGGACGTGVRYLITLWAAERFPAFPVGTLIVNVVGCFLISAIMHLATNVAGFSPTLRLALVSGFLGGLTTYSSLNYETTMLARDGAFGSAALNFAVTAGGCLAAGFLGLVAARRWIG